MLGHDAAKPSPQSTSTACWQGGEPLPEPKMSIDEAIAYHSEPIPEDVLASYAEYGDDTPTLSTRFEFVEVEVPAALAAQAS